MFFQDAGSALYIVEIFSGLERLDKDLKIQPDVAESFDVSADGTTYGVGVASKFLAVGAVVPAAAAGVGALATQAWANLAYRPDGIKRLEDRGVTNIMVGFRMPYAVGPDPEPLEPWLRNGPQGVSTAVLMDTPSSICR